MDHLKDTIVDFHNRESKPTVHAQRETIQTIVEALYKQFLICVRINKLLKEVGEYTAQLLFTNGLIKQAADERFPEKFDDFSVSVLEYDLEDILYWVSLSYWTADKSPWHSRPYYELTEAYTPSFSSELPKLRGIWDRHVARCSIDYCSQ